MVYEIFDNVHDFSINISLYFGREKDLIFQIALFLMRPIRVVLLLEKCKFMGKQTFPTIPC